ncbi:MAG: cytochrome c3 family protein [Verrucomicrobiota bacterium]
MRLRAAVILLIALWSAPLARALETNTLSAAAPIPGAPPPAAAPIADNSRCFVCHANYEDEQLSVSHAKANVGCIRCHGNSSPHSTDEDGLTAPDRMYPKGHVRLNCLSCHDWIKLVGSDQTKTNRTYLPEKPDHQAVLDGTNRLKPFCTDCHGQHRMYYRTKGWNKRSGVLLFKDGIPLMAPNAPK